ncbi:beta-lactamase superfamily domain-containing protein [Dendryphion nanum]|uniref:Beta-lactamase superfamily domain-containing protein n=1 Tax=Dendryphion nanum TaxID=256645 RepID=A0A9P9ILQ8_9PLEO|nr:beta-lactamase superfamily domain-containing protein [Dendryphion nanum]
MSSSPNQKPQSPITITPLPPNPPPSHPTTTPPSHHVTSPPTSFKNPWPSYAHHTSPLEALKTRWFNSANKNSVPIPTDPSELVRVRNPPDFLNSKVSNPTLSGDATKNEPSITATWLGHASFLIQARGGSHSTEEFNILLDPVFSERVGPYGLVGPVRFTKPPCEVADLPHIDSVLISHDHYDHLDSPTLSQLHKQQNGHIRFFCALGVKNVLVNLGIGIVSDQVTELDWWDGVRISRLKATEKEEQKDETDLSIDLICTPSQHRSGRTPWSFESTLWCSWVLKASYSHSTTSKSKSIFFAGDTGYRSVPSSTSTSTSTSPPPPCPAFSEIGTIHGPFTLSLLPIGCYSPRAFMSAVHASPADSIAIHRDVKSEKSIGMHYGTFRGSISAHYEPVTEPVVLWREEAEREGLGWRGDGDSGEWEVGVCDIGEGVVV